MEPMVIQIQLKESRSGRAIAKMALQSIAVITSLHFFFILRDNFFQNICFIKFLLPMT